MARKSKSRKSKTKKTAKKMKKTAKKMAKKATKKASKKTKKKSSRKAAKNSKRKTVVSVKSGKAKATLNMQGVKPTGATVSYGETSQPEAKS